MKFLAKFEFLFFLSSLEPIKRGLKPKDDRCISKINASYSNFRRPRYNKISLSQNVALDRVKQNIKSVCENFHKNILLFIKYS